ncbi:MAG TPA: response regulator transcription factor [Mycobacteriales bacterium]|jgi:DNA-binding NarL/FixJ family response regulator
MDTGQIRVMLVDDHALFVRGLELLLPEASEGRVAVVGVTDDAAAAALLARRCVPDVALVDLAMPPPGGLRAIAAIRHTTPAVHVAALSGTEDPDLATEAIRAGADGFLPKSAQPDELVEPLCALAYGWSVLPPSLLHHLAGREQRSAHLPASLRPEQRRLWQLVATGASTADIAADLHVSERTVKRMVSTLLRRLGVTTRAEAAALAGRAGLLDRDRD